MSDKVIDLCAVETDKENVVLKEKNTKNCKTVDNDKTDKNDKEKDKIPTGESLLSPPRKKLKQDSIAFPKISKEQVKKQNTGNTIEEEKEKVETQQINGEVHTSPSKENCASNPNDVSSTESPLASSQKKQTPKSPALSKEEREKQRLEKEQLKQEKLKELEDKKKQKEEEKKKREEERLQKQTEKEKKEQERKAEKEKKEQERKEKERLREEDKKKKEEERKKKEELREAEKEKKEAERKQKEAEREKKEVERKLEEEKKKQKEEAEKKKKTKAANQFKSFFTKKAQSEKKPTEKPAECRFISFQVTPNMTLAPCVRVPDFNKTKLDTAFDKEVPDVSTYLEELSILLANNKQPVLVSRRKLRRETELRRKAEVEEIKIKNIENGTTVVEDKEEEPKTKRRKSSLSALDTSNTEVVVIEDDNSNDNSTDDEDEDETSFVVDEKRLMNTKFLKFDENTRPPYYGTWSKKTKHITGRKPFGQDTNIFNYDVDSDEEWIDEPGEDCSDNGEEDDEEEKEDEDDEDGFFVPHGYLSDDEGVKADSDDDGGDEEEGVKKIPISKEAAEGMREQDKLKTKVASFEVKFKKKLKPRKPICIGITFTNNPDEVNPMLKEYLKISMFRSKGENEANVETTENDKDGNVTKSFSETPESGCSFPQTVPEEAMPFLLRLIHGNSTAVFKMIKEFQLYWIDYTKKNEMTDVRSNISKRQLEKKIQSIATKGQNTQLGKVCYTVNTDTLAMYDLSGLQPGTGLSSVSPEQKDLALTQKSEKSPVTSTRSPITSKTFTTESTSDVVEQPVSTNSGTAVDSMEID